MKIINTIREKINVFLEFTACILLAFMVILITADVFCRYVLKFSFRWSEEVSLILLIWFCFTTMSIGVNEHLHLKIEMFTAHFPAGVKKVLQKAIEVLMLVISVLLVIFGVRLVTVSMKSTLPATGLPTGILYVMIPIAGIMMVLNTAFDLFNLRKTGQEKAQEEEKR